MAKQDWVPSWLRGNKDDEEEEEKNKIKLPKELKEEIEGVVKASNKGVEDKLKGLDSLVAFADEYKKDKEDARKAKEEEEAERKRVEAKNKKDEETDEDLAARLLSDPKSVLAESSKPAINLALTIRADNVRREVFEDRKNDFPYYDGDVKKEVDSILNGQSLQFRNDPQSVENVYYTVVGKKQKEISEGKIKSRFASSSSSTNGTDKTNNEDFKLDVTDELRRAARLSGMPIDDYMKVVEKAAKAGEIEYV